MDDYDGFNVHNWGNGLNVYFSIGSGFGDGIGDENNYKDGTGNSDYILSSEYGNGLSDFRSIKEYR